jgi:2-polyprenyl-3-methyl-5-hydroxy-6-metoxy-1,4-benzoquinol methylase
MEKNYYKEYYHLEREHWWFQARAEILMSHIKSVFNNKKDLKILNIGAATGYSSQLLMQFGEVTSIEYDKDCYEFTRDTVKIPIINASITDLPFEENTYDLVCAFDVIEHIEDDKAGVKEMRRVCKSGGVLFVSVPAYMFLWSEHDVVNHHFRRYTASQLRGVFDAQDANIFHSYFNFWLFFPIAFIRLLKGKAKNVTADQAQSDFNSFKSGILNRVLYFIFKSENIFLKNNIKLPVGVSIMSSWRKE